MKSVSTRAWAKPFLKPVDWKAMGLLDYPEIIQRPIDIGYIRRRLERNRYETPEDVASDMELMFSNCVTYNMDEKS